jgi:penicillin-insensitive murein endopeptidase
MRIWGILYIFSIALAAVNVNGQDLPQNEWSRVLTPSQGKPTSIGFYSNGCISGAETLPLDGVGYQVMRPFRNRYYGHTELIQFIQSLGKTMDALGSGVLIGDMGQPRGGPLPYGHASHQVGLDTDVWFWTHPEQRTRSLTVNERNTLPFVDMLNSNGVVDPTKFTNDQILKLKTAAANPLVQRIFVNPAIKVYLCSTLDAKDKAWLHTLRPWPGHNEHFHVRLRCPAGSTGCTPQDEQPAGDGCSEVLAQNKVTDTDSTHMTETETDDQLLDQFLNSANNDSVPPAIPAACTKVLKEKP